MSNQGALGGTRQRSNSESGPFRLNSTSIEDKLFAEPADLSTNRNALTHQSKQTIPTDLPEGFIESAMLVGTGTRLQVRRLPTGNDWQAFIQSQYDGICDNIISWQIKIDEEPITFKGINTQFIRIKGSIHSLYQEALHI